MFGRICTDAQEHDPHSWDSCRDCYDKLQSDQLAGIEWKVWIIPDRSTTYRVSFYTYSWRSYRGPDGSTPCWALQNVSRPLEYVRRIR